MILSDCGLFLETGLPILGVLPDKTVDMVVAVKNFLKWNTYVLPMNCH